MNIKRQIVLSMLLTCSMFLTGVLFGKDQSTQIRDQAEQSEKAANVFNEIMKAPDRSIPESVLNKAECIAVFPAVIKGGFIVGGRGGRGVASCRTTGGWSAPAFFNLGGGSFGLQIGVEATDFVFLFMNQNGMNSLLSSKFTLGGDASASAGPVGREAGAETDLKMNAEILSYSRSKGLFAGLELKGVVIEPDRHDMEGAYGSGTTARDVLLGAKTPIPAALQIFPHTLAQYSLRK
jgi:lipid-binding SYLF domain-containing protein